MHRKNVLVISLQQEVSCVDYHGNLLVPSHDIIEGYARRDILRENRVGCSSAVN